MMIINNSLFLNLNPITQLNLDKLNRLNSMLGRIISRLEKYGFREYITRGKIELMYVQDSRSIPVIVFGDTEELKYIDVSMGSFGMLISSQFKELIPYESINYTHKSILNLLVLPTPILFLLLNPILL